MNVELRVVDSNRIRKKYNKTITHFAKPKSDAPGGFVCCGSKGPTLTFKVCKLADKTETRKFIKDPVFRRASQILRDAAKEDEVSEASILDSPSRAGSLVAAGPLATEPTADKEESPEDPVSPTSEANSPTSAEVSAPTPAPSEPAPVESTPATDAAVEAVTTTTTVELAPEPVAVAEVTPVVATDGLSTIELSGTTPDVEAMDGSAPVHDKISTHETMVLPTTMSAATVVASETERLPSIPDESQERVDTACIGGTSCSIM
ncbi:hypothetical protein PINS_up003829 [Pythium insidiosum]|nr:hypothetical protein PINS_up003829 [Pythium insidiosum]